MVVEGSKVRSTIPLCIQSQVFRSCGGDGGQGRPLVVIAFGMEGNDGTEASSRPLSLKAP